ncbi:hypothetical protein B7P43_G16499 [Cryptotermes secundus]|uniref:MI domain-containing protein n=1 Tax=Cryptotermes secundus TaxID=105785 RepID=A0A2J7QWM1_9NEOP|nr:hypothetical protein B7P43_G16499 [Cryptotermes secundus]
MDSKTKSRQVINLESLQSDMRSRPHFSSSDTGINRYVAGMKEEGYSDRKKHDDGEDHRGIRKRRPKRDSLLDEDRSGKENKRKKSEEGEEIGLRMSYHKHENDPTYSKRRGNRINRERDSKYQNERFDKYYSNINTKHDLQEDTFTNNSSTQQNRTVNLLTSRTGGAYIPPAKLRMMQAQIMDKSGASYQRIEWEALKKSIHGHINKVNTGNIAIIVRELLKENIVRGRGLLCRSIIQAQAASMTFTHVYAALVAVINSKFPNIGELLLRRLVIQFRRGFKHNDKTICISAATFIAHLVNQRVAHEILALEILTLLVETPTDDSVEVAIAFLKECGMKLMEVSNKGILAIFEMLRNILHEGQLDKRVQYMIEVIFQVRKDEFRDHEALLKEPYVFKFDPEYEANEEKYSALRKEILDEGDSTSESDSSLEEENDSEEGSENEENNNDVIIDNTETNLVALRRTIYLTINSSLDFEECAHKLRRMELKPGQEIELCHMILDCCAQQRTYEKFFGLLAERFCRINKEYSSLYGKIFRRIFERTHHLKTRNLQNIAKFFSHLLFSETISWDVFSIITLTEEKTTSASRIFIKYLLQELAEAMGLQKLSMRLKDS